jgi:hypothetical protein
MPLLSWRFLEEVNAVSGFIYLVRVIDDAGQEYRYVGKARNESRLREYKNNMIKIAERRPRGVKQRYRAVHFALAKALEHGWQYEIVAIESPPAASLLARERHHRAQSGCNLNGARTWDVSEYATLQISDLLRVDA